MNLTDNEKRDAVGLIEAGKPLPNKYRFLLFDDKREVELVMNGSRFALKKDRQLELQNVFLECRPGPRKIAIKVVDIFGNDTMKIMDVRL